MIPQITNIDPTKKTAEVELEFLEQLINSWNIINLLDEHDDNYMENYYNHYHKDGDISIEDVEWNVKKFLKLDKKD